MLTEIYFDFAMLLPVRHFSFLAVSLLSIIAGSLFLSLGVFSGLLFFLAILSTLMFGIISREKWFALLWPIVFILLGLVNSKITFLPIYVLLGGSFGMLYCIVQGKTENLLNFSFFLVVKPALSVFLLLCILASAAGIYLGLPAETIETTIQKGIHSFEEIPLPGGENITGFLQEFLDKSREQIGQENVLTGLLEERIKAECQGNEECIEEIRGRLTEQLNASENSELFPIPSAEEVTAEAKNMLQRMLDFVTEKINLSLLASLLFLLILLPFSGILAWILSVICYLFFWLFRLTKAIRQEERTVVQKIFM